MAKLVTAFTVGVGFTVTLNVVGGPVHTPAVAVTETVATTGDVPVFVAVKVPILPVPLVPKPTLADDVHANVAPPVGLLKLKPAPDTPLQRLTLVTAFTVGAGLTVTLNVMVGPVQPLAVAVTETVATTGVVPAFTAV
jgi:hypothetical protein